MRLRTFTAPDMPSAMEMVREALGDDAIILSSQTKGIRQVVVTAAMDTALPIASEISEKKVEKILPSPARHPASDLRFELQNILRFHNLPELYIAKMLQKASDTDLRAATALHRISGNRDPKHLQRLGLEKLTAAFFDFAPLPFDENHFRLMLVGPPGAGKTLTIAKFAARLAMDNQPLTVITTDNKRAGGIEQLKAFTDILSLDLKVAASRSELTEIMKSESSRVLIDTAGCNPYEQDDIKELAALAAVGGIEPILVLPAGGDAMEAIDAAEIFSALPIRRILVTRADSARRFGGIIATAAAHGLAFCNISHSASIIDPLQPMDASLLANLLFKYQLQPSATPATLEAYDRV